MAVVLDDTVGGEDSNTYINLADAEIYFEKRLDSTDWDNATDAVKDEALAMATRMLDDAYNFVGTIHTSAQALRWPRSYVYDIDGRYLTPEAIPEEIRNATCEQALYAMGRDVTSTPTILSQGLKYAKVGPLEVEASLAFQQSGISSNATASLKGLGSLRSNLINLHRA